MSQFVRIITITTDQSGNLMRLDALINNALDDLQDDCRLVAIHPPVVTLLGSEGQAPTLHYAVMMVWEVDDEGYDME